MVISISSEWMVILIKNDIGWMVILIMNDIGWMDHWMNKYTKAVHHCMNCVTYPLYNVLIHETHELNWHTAHELMSEPHNVWMNSRKCFYLNCKILKLNVLEAIDKIYKNSGTRTQKVYGSLFLIPPHSPVVWDLKS